MESNTIVEFLGYLASLTVVFSLTRTSVKKLWIINAFGGVAFIIYAMIVKSYPGALMNLGAVIIDVVQLYRLSRVKESFELVEADTHTAYFKRFVEKHREDLESLCPDFAFEKSANLYYYLRDNEVAGLLAFNKSEDNKADITLDYVTTKFRDCKIGRYFFGENSEFLKDSGIRELTTHTTNPKHIAYLKQMQFRPLNENEWVKSV